MIAPTPPRRARIRRTVEEARRNILDAAEAMLAADGPAGLRLQDVAKRAGVSHPAILHHFGSREALVADVTRRSVDSLTAALEQTLRYRDFAEIIAGVFAACRGGLAQRLAFLAATGTPADPERHAALERIGDVLHQRRVEERGTADRDETASLVHLVGIVALGQAIFGEFLSATLVSGTGDADRRFERWFTAFVVDHPAVTSVREAA